MEFSSQGAYLSCWNFWRERPEDLEAAMIEAAKVVRTRRPASADLSLSLLILPITSESVADALEER